MIVGGGPRIVHPSRGSPCPSLVDPSAPTVYLDRRTDESGIYPSGCIHDRLNPQTVDYSCGLKPPTFGGAAGQAQKGVLGDVIRPFIPKSSEVVFGVVTIAGGIGLQACFLWEFVRC